MLSPAQIKQYAENRYRDYLRSLISAPPLFPLDVRFGRLKTTVDLTELITTTQTLLRHSKEATGKGYSVTLEATTTRRYGVQPLPSRVWFDTEHDYLTFIGKVSEAARFKEQVSLMRQRCPGLAPWCTSNIAEMLDHQDDWEALISVCAWFKEHPRPQCYAREIPLPLPTKFIETHTTVLGSMLKDILPDDYDPAFSDFHSRFYLKDKEPLVRIRILDEEIMRTTGVPLSDFAVPVSVFEGMPFASIPRVVVIENEVTFLTFPLVSGTVVIWGQGNGVHRIASAPWLHDGARVVYWGDVDAHGVTILARLRRRLPLIRSALMDEATLSAFPEAETQDPSKDAISIDSELLTDAEWQCYRLVTKKTPRRRLEQERIPMSHALEKIKEVIP